MVNNKKALLVGLCALASVALASCGGGGTPAGADLSIWCPSTDNDLTETIIEDFKKDNADYASKTIKVIANAGEGDVYGLLS